MKKIPAALSLVVFCVLCVVAGRQFLSPKTDFTNDQRALLRSKGDPGAPFWIVEHLDYQCLSCRVASQVLEDYSKKYPSKIYLQVRFHPLKSHSYGLKTAIYAECAARQGKFWKWHELLLEKQPEWSQIPADQIDAAFERYAQSLGIHLGKLRACVKDSRVEAIVLEEKETAKAMEVKLTPTFFINGKMVVGHGPLEEELESIFTEKKGAGA